jgi:hypothetical protein
VLLVNGLVVEKVTYRDDGGPITTDSGKSFATPELWARYVKGLTTPMDGRN